MQGSRGKILGWVWKIPATDIAAKFFPNKIATPSFLRPYKEEYCALPAFLLVLGFFAGSQISLSRAAMAMTEKKKRKYRDESRQKLRPGMEKKKEKKKMGDRDSKSTTTRFNEPKRKTGPRLPSLLQKEVEALNPNPDFSDDEVTSSDEIKDVYEFEEGVPEEESKKNRRFDPVENYEYELPEKFEVPFPSNTQIVSVYLDISANCY